VRASPRGPWGLSGAVTTQNRFRRDDVKSGSGSFPSPPGPPVLLILRVKRDASSVRKVSRPYVAKKPAIIDSDEREKKPLFVILVVGVKTVSGKDHHPSARLAAKKLRRRSRKVMLAAGDNFRAAAIEQLKVLGEPHQIRRFSAGRSRSDSESLAFPTRYHAGAGKGKLGRVLVGDFNRGAGMQNTGRIG